MITRNEAGERARELVMRYAAEAQPKCEQDYLKLLIMLGTVVTNTLAAYLGSDHAGIRQINGGMDLVADEMRRRGPETCTEANSTRMH